MHDSTVHVKVTLFSLKAKHEVGRFLTCAYSVVFEILNIAASEIIVSNLRGRRTLKFGLLCAGVLTQTASEFGCKLF